MGRRARTNCSPIDSAMEKYHNDIGSRLSGVFVPPQPCLDNGLNSSDLYNNFTLNLRSKGSGAKPQAANSDEHHGPSPAAPSQNSPLPSTELVRNPPSDGAVSSKSGESHSCGDDKEKKGLVDKLTRALFQRKHTCTRCQRKSRSCLPNKNFNATDKHYMCGRCRESSHVMKTLISGQNVASSTKGNQLTNASPASDVIVPKPRIHLKDSGYDTVTSCSTVASSNSHSTFSGPTKPDVAPSRLEGANQPDNSDTPRPESNPNHQTITPGFPVQTWHPNPVGLEQYMGVTSDHSNVQVLKQVKTRYVDNYDGYLPSTGIQNSHTNALTRPALPLPAANASSSQDLDGQYEAANSRHSPDHVHSNSKVTRRNKNPKMCYTCGSSSKPCFRLPWEGGWLCEDCLDGVF